MFAEDELSFRKAVKNGLVSMFIQKRLLKISNSI